MSANKPRMTTMATPPKTASANSRHVKMLERKWPSMAQIPSSVSAPNRQRQNTTSITGWPDISTNQPIVPEISMAAVISRLPVLISFSITSTPLNEAKDYDATGSEYMDFGRRFVHDALS
jgi:hypothetical protein